MVSLNTGYVKSVQGILKILEIITICVAYSCLADFDRDIVVIGGKYEGRYDFFMAVFVIGWAVVLFVFFVFLLTLEGKLTTEKNWNIMLLVFSALFALLFIISSSLMADFLDDLYDARWHKVSWLKRRTEVLTVSVFFGFVSAALLLVDTVLVFMKVKG